MVDPITPWFAERAGEFLVYRVNRRPLDQPSLLDPMPEDVFEHFLRVLAPGYEVVTGRRHQRTWRVGGIRVDDNRRLLTGKLGWTPLGEAIVPQWSEERKDWISDVTEPQGGRVVPFGFDGETRLLTVLRDTASAPTTVAAAIEKILRANEAELPAQSTRWSVEPVLDKQQFLRWLRSLDVVRSVTFTVSLPNPEPDEPFQDLFNRLRDRHADRLSSTMRSKREEGLSEVERDPEFSQAISMAERGFAELKGRGTRNGRKSRFSQKDQVARERVERLPSSWEEVADMVGYLLKEPLRRFVDKNG